MDRPGLVTMVLIVALVAGACSVEALGGDSVGPESLGGGAITTGAGGVAAVRSSAPDPIDLVGTAPSLMAPQPRGEPVRYRSIEAPIEPVPARVGPLLPRDVSTQTHTPFATVGGLTLVHPSSSVETIGFHESNHDGARQMEPLATAVDPFTMATRNRGTGSRTAADIVVEPDVPIVAPVTGTVLRAGSYTLYCDYRDHFVVIAPDEQPGWEVKMLHFLDLQVAAGQRVEAGITVLGSGPRPLAFRSQVDDATAAPSWPHVHIEVVDPSIPDRPSGISC